MSRGWVATCDITCAPGQCWRPMATFLVATPPSPYATDHWSTSAMPISNAQVNLDPLLNSSQLSWLLKSTSWFTPQLKENYLGISILLFLLFLLLLLLLLRGLEESSSSFCCDWQLSLSVHFAAIIHLSKNIIYPPFVRVNSISIRVIFQIWNLNFVENTQDCLNQSIN